MVLAGEAGLPLAMVGFVTVYANGVTDETEPIDALLARMRESTGVLASPLAAVVPPIDRATPAGFVYRFEQGAT